MYCYIVIWRFALCSRDNFIINNKIYENKNNNNNNINKTIYVSCYIEWNTEENDGQMNTPFYSSRIRNSSEDGLTFIVQRTNKTKIKKEKKREREKR